MNRQQRRAIARATGRSDMPPLCQPGEHKLGPIRGTVKGEVVASVVMCARCRRTFGEILAADPAYAATYRAWLDAGQPDEWPPA